MFDKVECVTILGCASVVCSASSKSEPMSCNEANLLFKSSSNSMFQCGKEFSVFLQLLLSEQGFDIVLAIDVCVFPVHLFYSNHSAYSLY